MTRRILLVSGEPSGDRIARQIVMDAREAQPDWTFSGMVGPTVPEVTQVATRPEASMGALDVISGALALRTAAGALLREARHCDLSVLVDFHGFTLPLGRALKSQGTPVVLISAPQVWAWRPSRARSLDLCADAIGCLLDFEPQGLRALGVLRANTVFLGHPAAQGPRLVPSRGASLLGLFAGSRARELDRLGPALLAASRVLSLRAVVEGSLAAMAPEQEGHEFFTKTPYIKGIDASRGVLSRARAAIACSGTVTLECALAGVPTVVVYRTDALTFLAARALVRSRYLALPNVLVGRAALTEVLQGGVSPAALVDAVESALSPENLRSMESLSQELRERLTTPEGFASRALSLLASALP